jgi:2-oxo-3-hexenedioate decarboxylase
VTETSADSRIAVIAQRLLDAYDRAGLLAPITAEEPDFDVADAYAVLDHIAARRRNDGWHAVGRKIGFTNRTIWERYNVSGPMWAPVWDRTTQAAPDGVATVSLAPFAQPRLEPEVVFRLLQAPPITDDAERVLACVEWMAAGFEIVQCPFPGWKFAAPDCTAAFGLHGTLVVGAPVALTGENRAAIAALLPTFTATLSRAGDVVDRGIGANVLGSPALALVDLARAVASQPHSPPLAAGEIITTGTLPDAWPIVAGEKWSSDYGELGLPELRVTFA